MFMFFSNLENLNNIWGRGYFAGLRVIKRNKATVLLIY